MAWHRSGVGAAAIKNMYHRRWRKSCIEIWRRHQKVKRQSMYQYHRINVTPAATGILKIISVSGNVKHHQSKAASSYQRPWHQAASAAKAWQ